MINQDFINETDKLIALFKEREIKVYNSNLIVAKVKTDKITKGGIVLPDDTREIKDFHTGLARIIAVADNADKQYTPGLYIIHSHEARYKILEEAIQNIADTLIEKDSIYAVQDNNVLMVRSI